MYMFGSVVLMGGLGIIIGTALVIASKAFYVYEDPKVVAITEALPGANCGGCGVPGCGANAEAIVMGKAAVNSCVAAGEDVAMAIAEIMGVSITDKEPEFADVGCYYPLEKSDVNYIYDGIADCRAATLLLGGMKTCRIGCIGLGTCVTACPFGALTIEKGGLPRVDLEKCTGCGTCERVCPKHIIKMTSTTRRIIREYTLDDCVTPCQRACPTGIDIREYIRLIRNKEYRKSLEVIKERNPFPTVISRICPATCEMNCRRLLQDEPVAINHLKRFVCDYDMNQDQRAVPYKAPGTGKKIAVIGGGVEGLSAAYFSARLGHDATVYEATDSFGGILRKAISRKRLAMDILDWDIRGVADMGVEMKPGMKAGKDFTLWKLLEQGYDAVYTATGGWDSRLALDKTGEVPLVIPGTFLLIDLLGQGDRIKVPGGCDHAVIAGGEASAADAAAFLKKTGVKAITLVSRKEADAFDPQTLDQLKKEGVTLVYRSGITRLNGDKEKLCGIEIMDLATGVVQHLDTDMLILAAGRFPSLVFSKTGPQDETPDLWEGIERVKEPANNQEQGLLSAHDVISEYHSAVAAINGGRKAAAVLHYVMYGISFQDTSNLITRYSLIQDVAAIDRVDLLPRHGVKINMDRTDLEIEAFEGFAEETALSEASRCLRCGLLCYERSGIQDFSKDMA
jgi:NADPH-dependent glutamate synthase beta subunit-like oxidoreductase